MWIWNISDVQKSFVGVPACRNHLLQPNPVLSSYNIQQNKSDVFERPQCWRWDLKKANVKHTGKQLHLSFIWPTSSTHQSPISRLQLLQRKTISKSKTQRWPRDNPDRRQLVASLSQQDIHSSRTGGSDQRSIQSHPHRWHLATGEGHLR